MIEIKLAVKGMKAEIIKCFDVQAISAGIRQATEKAVAEFDVESYIAKTVKLVLFQAREAAVDELQAAYGHQLADKVSALVDDKLQKALAAV